MGGHPGAPAHLDPITYVAQPSYRFSSGDVKIVARILTGDEYVTSATGLVMAAAEA